MTRERNDEAIEFAAALERAFRRATGRRTTHGAQAWLAGRLGVNHTTVHRWVHAQHPPPAEAWAAVEPRNDRRKP